MAVSNFSSPGSLLSSKAELYEEVIRMGFPTPISSDNSKFSSEDFPEVASEYYFQIVLMGRDFLEPLLELEGHLSLNNICTSGISPGI